MKGEFYAAIAQIASERSLAKDVILESVEAALISAYKRMTGSDQSVTVQIDPASGQAHVFAQKTVVEQVEDPRAEISLADARALEPGAQLGDTVLVNYIGRTISDKVFDSSIQAEAQKAGLNQPGRNYEPLQVILGTTPIISGWNEGLLLLNEGSKAKLIIPSNLGYGEQGAGEDIPPYSTLIFDVELVKVKPIKHAAPKPAPKKATATTKKHTVAKKKS